MAMRTGVGLVAHRFRQAHGAERPKRRQLGERRVDRASPEVRQRAERACVDFVGGQVRAVRIFNDAEDHASLERASQPVRVQGSIDVCAIGGHAYIVPRAPRLTGSRVG